MSLCDYASAMFIEVLIILSLSQSLLLFFFILLFVGGSLDYQMERLTFFTKPLQATVMLSLNFAESLKAYFMRLCLCALRF